ncbi:MAG: beta-lactamase family protein, partial [Acetobacter sp.]|nr:beta-lactamase family protein [Acetobacter sp.]
MNHIENLSSRRALLKQMGAVSGLLLAGSTGACSKDVSGNPFIQADDLIRQAVKRGDMPGAVLAVGHGGKIVHRDVFGDR